MCTAASPLAAKKNVNKVGSRLGSFYIRLSYHEAKSPKEETLLCPNEGSQMLIPSNGGPVELI